VSKGTAVAKRNTDEKGAIQLLLDLEVAGNADEVSLTLTDPEMKYGVWEALGRFLGSLDRRSRWYIGDWLNFGEAVFGEEAAQGVDDTTKTRYSEAERVTGLDHGTLMNIRSVCGKVAKSRRRKELGFWIHAEVAPLEPDEQTAWLQKAIDEGWTRGDLRDAIRAEKNPAADDDTADDTSGVGEGLSICERVEEAARRVFHQAQSTTDGSFLVPAEPMASLRAALGEE
jgi:hypothetical protein